MIATVESASFRDLEASGAFVPTLCCCECLFDSPNGGFSTTLPVRKNNVNIHPFPWFGCPCSDVNVALVLGGQWVLAFGLVERLRALGFINVPCRGVSIESGESVSFRNPEASGAIVPTLCGCEYFSDSPHRTFSVAWAFSEHCVDVHPFSWFGCLCSIVSVVLAMGGLWVLVCCLFG